MRRRQVEGSILQPGGGVSGSGEPRGRDLQEGCSGVFPFPSGEAGRPQGAGVGSSLRPGALGSGETVSLEGWPC